jgi:hypothetical protein
VWGVTEPAKMALGSGRSMPHGRRDRHLPNRTASLTPERIVVLRRGSGTRIRAAESADVARAMTAATYAAGELRRYWAFAAVLALGTGIGPAHPDIGSIARMFADRLPCVAIDVANPGTVPLSNLLRGPETSECV